MSVNPGQPTPAASQTQFSADGFWWWDGAEWKPAVSPDRRWRWSGSGWLPAAPPPAARAGNGLAIGLIVGAFVFFLLVAAVVTLVVVLLIGGHLGG